MRAVNFLGLVLLGIVVVILAPAVTVGQFQPGGKKGGFGGGGGGFGGGGQDPNAMFDYLAKGRTFFLISETRMLNGPLTQFSQEKGITNGQITRQQYLDFSDWRAKQAAAGGGGAGFGGGFPGGGFGGGGFGKSGGGFGKKMGGDSPAQPPPSLDVLAQRADAEFKLRDKNGDGRLNREEMSDRLRNSLATWDKNGDGLLDFNEFKDYFIARELERAEDPSGGRGIATIIIEEEDLDKKPVVFRVGAKSPPGLPSWFNELDTDKDGQVALYEWRKGNKSMDEFPNWDLNGDGFITMDEAIKQQSVIVRNNPKGSSGAVASASEEGNSGGNGGSGRRPPGMGKGNEEGGGGSNPWSGKGFGGKGFGGKGGKKPGSN